MVSKQQLAIRLSQLQVFAAPDVRLEQYPTDADVAAALLWEAYMHGDIEGKRILDFGAGTGILGIGCLELGAEHVTFVELDIAALPQLTQNLSAYPVSSYTIITGSVLDQHVTADTIVQNPPFGTRSKNADLLFLEKALASAPVTYTLHKTSTISYLTGWIERHNHTLTHSWNFSYLLKNTMQHHTRRLQRIEVSGLRIISRK